MASSGKSIPTPVSANCSGALMMSASPTDITGCSVSLTPGWWKVEGVFDFNGNGDAAQVGLGSIVTSGGTASISNSASVATFRFEGASSRGTSSQSWLINVTATTTCKLQGAKTGGAGTSTISTTHTTMTATYAGP